MVPTLLALAEVPPLYPQPEPPDVAAAFEALANAEGRTGPAADVRCSPYADGIVLCFRFDDGGKRKYVTEADVVAWRADDAALVSAATARAAALDDARFERTAIADTAGGVYWVSRRGDGLDGAAFLDPRRLERIAGGPVVVAMPTASTFLFWRPDGGEVDRIVAVGVRRMADAADHPVSDRVYRWDGTRWRVWGQAVPSEGQGSGSAAR
jgi:hypothetical protein